MQHQPWHRPARALLAVRRALDRRTHQACGMQHTLRPTVAARQTVLLHQTLVEMLDRPTRVARSVQVQNPVHLVRPNPVRADLAQTPIQKPAQPFLVIARPLTPERALRNAQPFGRLRRAQTPLRITIVDLLEPLHADLL
jgi:hypothetical protein